MSQAALSLVLLMRVIGIRQEGHSHGGPRKSHSIPKAVRQPARARGELHPAFTVANDTRIIARFGVGFWKLHPVLGARIEAPRMMEGDSAKWGKSGCLAFDRLMRPKIVSSDTLFYHTNA